MTRAERLRIKFPPCTLRAAIEESNAHAGRDTIDVPAGVFKLTHSKGGLTVTDSAGIAGAGADATIVDGNGRGIRALRIGDGATDPIVNSSGWQVRNAKEGGIRVNEDAYLSFVNSKVADNDATSAGAGIYNGDGQLLVADSTVSGNVVAARGGGIAASPDASSEVVDSTVSDNSANQGGGINSSGQLRLTNSTVSGNHATFSGGGLINSGLAYLSGSTITANEANEDLVYGASGERTAGGILSLGEGSVHMWNTILAGNTDHNESSGLLKARDCRGEIESHRNNILGVNESCTLDDAFSSSTPFDQVGTAGSPLDAQLWALSDNGGPTRTHRPKSMSPALDEGSAFEPGTDIYSCKPADQRGVDRPLDGDGDGDAVCDVGAVERD